MSAAITFQVAVEAFKAPFEPGHLLRSEEVGHRGRRLDCAVFPVGPAVAAHVEHENIDQRSVADLADRRDRARSAWDELACTREMHGCARRHAQHELVCILLALMFGAGERLPRPPVVGNLMVVPLPEDRHFRVERAHILVEQIVFVVAAELGQRLGGLRLLFRYEVFP